MSVERNNIYKCPHCGKVIAVVNGGGPVPVCCGHEMGLVGENTTEAATEKHIPVVVEKDGVFEDTVGSVDHAMEDVHWIEWIELVADGVAYRKYLGPGEKPTATFTVKAEGAYARAYCNLHGLWRS